MIGFSPTANINRVPCWNLQFYDEADGGTVGDAILTVNHRSHTADISLSFEGGLTAGRLEINLGRLIADDFEKLVLAQLTEPDGDARRRVDTPRKVFVAVQIYWKDPLKAVVDFDDGDTIEVFQITDLKREVEGLDVTTRITGRRALYDRIASFAPAIEDVVEGADTFRTITEVLSAIGLRDGTDFEVYQPLIGDMPPGQTRMRPGQSPIEALAALRTQMIRTAPYRRGRSLYLIRDNKLHIGPYRPIPHEGVDALKPLDAGSGMIRAVANGHSAPLAAGEVVAGEAPQARKNYTVHCVGRRDLKPGDVVTFKAPSETAGLLGGFGLPPVPKILGGGADDTVTLYVSGISHRFNTTDGWLTDASGVVITGTPIAETAWDVVQTHAGSPPTTDESAQPTTAAGRIGQAVTRQIERGFNARPTTHIAEVRDHALQSTGSDPVEVAAQTTTVLRGLVQGPGPRQARLDDINREMIDIQANVPYATSFAWGPFGHVLPRYPGMRVMLLNNQSDDQDPVDIGALWRTDTDSTSATPTNTQAGDWWLILPAFPNGETPPAASGSAVALPDESAGATHDLITARGDRVIQVAGFTIRTIAAEGLPLPDDRPEVEVEDGGILISQDDTGAKVKINPDGSIEIVAAAGLAITTQDNVEIEAGGDMILTGNNIELNARGSGTVDAKNV